MAETFSFDGQYLLTGGVVLGVPDNPSLAVPPANVIAASQGKSGGYVTFSTGESNWFDPITQYRIVPKNNNGYPQWDGAPLIIDADPTNTGSLITATLTGLINGSNYLLEVSAKNSLGFGPAQGITAGSLSTSGIQGQSSTDSAPYGSQINYITPGTYTWVAPTGLNPSTVSVVCVGGGGGGYFATRGAGYNGACGGGAGLGWKNNISVTAGQSYIVVVGAGAAQSINSQTNGGDSYFSSTSVVKGGGGQGGSTNSILNYGGGEGGTYVGDGGGNGGRGGNSSIGLWNSNQCGGGGGGGAGGYTENGGNGAPPANIVGGTYTTYGGNTSYGSLAGAGGGAGGNYPLLGSLGGGGVGIYTPIVNGQMNTGQPYAPGYAGSYGGKADGTKNTANPPFSVYAGEYGNGYSTSSDNDQRRNGGDGGLYGGGGGGGNPPISDYTGPCYGGRGGNGAVRILYSFTGTNRLYPNSNQVEVDYGTALVI